MKDLLIFIIIWWRIMTYILFVLHNKQEVKCDMRKTEFLFLAWMCGWIVNSVDECWYGDSSITVCGEELWPPLLFLLWGLHIKWWHWILHTTIFKVQQFECWVTLCVGFEWGRIPLQWVTQECYSFKEFFVKVFASLELAARDR